LRRDPTGEKNARLLDMIANATSRGESLTRQLLAFSRRQTLTPAVIDLGERLPELRDMLNRSLRGDIAITVVVPDKSCAVKVDPSELELALLNLAVNARDAMPNGGARGCAASSSPSAWPIPGSAFRPTFCRTSSSRFSPPRRSARARDWG
jgi:two-component system NtrC family sensor kinase